MKKALSLLLAGVMCVGLLAGCGGQNTEDPAGLPVQHSRSTSEHPGDLRNKTRSIPCVSPLSPPASRTRSLPPPSP